MTLGEPIAVNPLSLVFLPIKTVNSLNAREHWAKRARRAKQERRLAYITTTKHPTPCRVHLVRCGPRLMDDDGVIASLKNVRDGIADRIGVDDGSELIKFTYGQRKLKDYRVEVAFLRDSNAGRG